MSEKKPCPFCGSERTYLQKYADVQGDLYVVKCWGCEAEGPPSRAFQDYAIERWNTRHNQERG